MTRTMAFVGTSNRLASRARSVKVMLDTVAEYVNQTVRTRFEGKKRGDQEDDSSRSPRGWPYLLGFVPRSRTFTSPSRSTFTCSLRTSPETVWVSCTLRLPTVTSSLTTGVFST